MRAGNPARLALACVLCSVAGRFGWLPYLLHNLHLGFRKLKDYVVIAGAKLLLKQKNFVGMESFGCVLVSQAVVAFYKRCGGRSGLGDPGISQVSWRISKRDHALGEVNEFSP